MQLSARVFIGPEIVASGERTIRNRSDPIAFPGRLEGDRSGGIVQARHTRGRILFVVLILRSSTRNLQDANSDRKNKRKPQEL